jgi:uncharacterized membrane protein (DUF4010 family)
MDLQLTQGEGLEHLPAFLTSLAIGLLIGIERERNPAARAGLRTFALVALFGTTAGLLSDRLASPWPLVAGLLIVGLMTVAANFRVREPAADPGTTTVVAIVLCYGLGAIIWYGYATLAVMLAITATILLYFKAELHGWSRNLTRRDLVSVLQFAVLSFIVLPILPNRDYGPYQALNPHQVWLMVVLISGVSLAGYVALRVVGQRYGAPLLGLLGGLVSSTATTIVYSRHGRVDERMARLAVVVIVLANLVVLVRIAILGGVVSPASLSALLPVLGAGFLPGLLVAAWLLRALGGSGDAPVPEIKNPTELRAALGFGVVYAAVLFLSAWLSDVAGSRGLYFVALASGATDVDAITLSSLRLLELGKLAAAEAATAIALAVVSNIGFKLALVGVIGGPGLARRCAPAMLACAAGLGAGLLLI